MSTMSNLDIQMREAGIDPEDMELEEAIDLLRSIEVRAALDDDCSWCEVPDMAIMSYDVDEDCTVIRRCPHPCKLTMPEHIAAEAIGLEDTQDEATG